MGRKRTAGARRGETKSSQLRKEKFDVRLATVLLAKGLVTSPEESVIIAESIVAEIEESENSREEACTASLEDYFSLSREDAKTTLSALLNLGDDDGLDSEDELSEEEPEPLIGEVDEEDDDDGDFIGEGECELCERCIRLTSHHLIPRSTWPRILPRLLNAAAALSKHDVNRAALILGPGLLHLLEPLTIADSDKAAIKGLLRLTCSVCRQCHNAIHGAHSNMILATNFSTTELLLKDENIQKFCKWASKQKKRQHSF